MKTITLRRTVLDSLSYINNLEKERKRMHDFYFRSGSLWEGVHGHQHRDRGHHGHEGNPTSTKRPQNSQVSLMRLYYVISVLLYLLILFLID